MAVPTQIPAIAVTLLLGAAAASADAPDPSGFVITANRVEGHEGPRGREVFLEEDVTIRRGQAVLVGDRGVYREADRLAIVYGNVHGVDGTATIRCDTLRYFRDLDRAVLTGNASYADTAGITVAERIELLREERLAVCVGDALAADANGRSELRAQRIVYDFDRSEARASGGPVITTFSDDGRVDAILEASAINLLPNEDLITAFGNVVITAGDGVTARARVATVLGREDSVVLEGDPVVEREGDVLSGARIHVMTADGEVSRVVSVGGARVSYVMEPESARDEVQSGRVDGDTLTMFLRAGDPTHVTVRGHAVSDHVVGTAGERSIVHAPTIDVFFADGRITRVAFRGGAEGTYTWVPEEPGIAPGESGSGGGGSEAGPPGGAEASAGSAAPAPSDSVALETVRYRADAIDYYVLANRIVLSGGGRVDYEDTQLLAERVVFSPGDQVLSATGAPDLREGDDRLVGTSLIYDLDGRIGAVEDGTTTFEEGLYYGRRIVRDEDGTLAVTQGVYTTCADSLPHYRLVSHRMKIYVNDKVIAKPVILYVGEIPVVALPFYVFPIRKDRHSGFLIPQIELGLSESKGRFIRNFGYYWAPNDYFDLALWGDYYEETKWIGHVEARYKRRYVLSGSVSASFMEEMLYNKRRWDLKFSHRQEFGRHWTSGASGDFRSDATYASDSFQTIEESVNRSLRSQLWLRGRWSGLSMGVTLDRREQIDQGSVSELLPKIDVTASQRPLVAGDDSVGVARWFAKISYSWTAKAVNDRDRSDGNTEVHQGLGVGLTLRGSHKVLGWLNVSPKLDVEQVLYDRDRLGRRFPGRFTYGAGVSVGTTVYGTFFPRAGPLEGLRHIIEPSASFSWTPEFLQYFDDSGSDVFYTFSGFGGTPRKRRAVSFSVVNKLQLKLRKGDDVRKIDNFARLAMSSSYDFEAQGHKWGELTSSLELRPDRALSVRWSVRHDTEDWRLENSSVTLGLSLVGSQTSPAGPGGEETPGGHVTSPVDELRRELAGRADAARVGARPWDASFTFRYSRGADPSQVSYWGDAKVAFSLTPNWRVNYSVHYDLKDREVASQEYTIYRDLHCWEAQFTRRYYEGEWQYYFRINVKALPEIQAEAGKKYLERRIR